MQDGMKIPKWDPRSRGAQFVGYSPLYASTVGLVRNLRTGNISPQFHMVYNDFLRLSMPVLRRNQKSGQN